MNEEDIDAQQEDREVAMGQNDASYNEITLTEKNIEPDKKMSGKLAHRNLQLGNVTPTQYRDLCMKINAAMQFRNVPFELGGFVSHDISDSIFKAIDLQLLTSNSVDGFLREIGTTRRTILTRQSIKTKGNKGIEQ